MVTGMSIVEGRSIVVEGTSGVVVVTSGVAVTSRGATGLSIGGTTTSGSIGVSVGAVGVSVGAIGVSDGGIGASTASVGAVFASAASVAGVTTSPDVSLGAGVVSVAPSVRPEGGRVGSPHAEVKSTAQSEVAHKRDRVEAPRRFMERDAITGFACSVFMGEV
jgi:hypothetical protein